LALALFVAPVLLDAAYDTSPRDLRDNWLPVTCLVLVAVDITTGAVAMVAHALTGMPWAAAIALGAIVAPPDAAAATAVLRQVSLPHRIDVGVDGGRSWTQAALQPAPAAPGSDSRRLGVLSGTANTF
jgi:CPA1 family monovalent cation:H+ antiporter